jgi:hypothetical protein
MLVSLIIGKLKRKKVEWLLVVWCSYQVWWKSASWFRSYQQTVPGMTMSAYFPYNKESRLKPLTGPHLEPLQSSSHCFLSSILILTSSLRLNLPNVFFIQNFFSVSWFSSVCNSLLSDSCRPSLNCILETTVAVLMLQGWESVGMQRWTHGTVCGNSSFTFVCCH